MSTAIRLTSSLLAYQVRLTNYLQCRLTRLLWAKELCPAPRLDKKLLQVSQCCSDHEGVVRSISQHSLLTHDSCILQHSAAPCNLALLSMQFSTHSSQAQSYETVTEKTQQ